MRKAEEPLERKLITLYEGDWKELELILAGRMTPTEFIRRSVRRTIERAQRKKEQIAQNLELEVDVGH